MAKLKIFRCSISGGQIKAKKGAANTFEAMINPESYSHSYSVQYSGTSGKGDRAVGKSAPVAKFGNVAPEKVSFSIVIDGTGVVEAQKNKTVAQRVDLLRDIAYTYDGDTHETNPVKIVWGKGLKDFYGRLTDLSVDYTLFHPDGKALRAKIKLSFIEAKTDAMEAREAGRNSPDMTHVVAVREGDTLPLLCHRIYQDTSKYLEVARFNNLDSISGLEAGTLLRFPPMR